MLTSAEAELLQSLVHHPGWEVLRRYVDETEEKKITRLAKRLRRGEDVDQRELDREIGFYKGQVDLLNHAESVCKQIEEAIVKEGS